MRENNKSEQELLLSAVWESSVDAMRITDSKGIVIRVNNAYCKLTGLKEEELLGKSFAIVYDKSEQKGLLDLYLDYISKGKPAERLDKNITFINGKKHSIDTLYSKINLPGKEYVLSIVRDNTTLIQAIEDLKESKEKYRGLSEAAFESIFISEKGICIEQNLTAEKMFGYTNQEALGRYGTEWIIPEDRDMVMNNMIAGFEEPYEATAIRKDGTTFPCMLRGKMMYYKGREVRVTSLSDLTERKNVENELRIKEMQFKDIMNQLPNSVLIHQQGKIVYANKAALSIIGYTEEEFLKSMVLDHVIEKDRKLLISMMQRRIEGQKAEDYEIGVITKSGKVRDAIIRTTDTQFFGEPSVIVLLIDITERKQAEALLKESEEKFRNLAALTPFAIMIYQDDLWVYTNPAGEKISGYFAEELYKMHYWDFVAPEYRELIKNRGKQRQSGTSVPTGYEFKIIAKDGSEKWVLLNGSLIEYHGKPAGIIAIADITNLKQIEKDLLIAKNKAEASDKLKTAFMNNISHEIRTPLNGILGIGQVIADPHLSLEDREQYYGMLKNSGHRLLNTVNDYMDISLIASGNQEVFFRPINIKNLINETYDSFLQTVSEKNIELSADISSDVSAQGKDFGFTKVISDDFLIKKILYHLLDNAVKFTQEGAISLGYSVKNDVIEFYVKDTGIGINKDSLKKIFDYFDQEDISISRGFEGSGLGLSISKGIVELLGGKIWVESVKGIGSTFFFTIPVSEPNIVSPLTAGVDTSTLPPLDSLEKVNLSSKPVILIAEDDKLNYIFYVTLLKKLKVDILHAQTGLEAVEHCKNNPDISLILMDLKMPEMNGLEATREIRTFRSNLPIIAVTAYAMSGDEKKAFDAGCSDYIAKPFNKNDLYQKLESFGITIDKFN